MTTPSTATVPIPSSTTTSSTASTDSIPTLPAIHTLPTQSPTALTQILSALFEPSASLSQLALPTAQRRQPSYAALIAAVGAQLRALPPDSAALRDILASHPRLGEKRIDSALSRAEQRAMAAASAVGGDDVGGPGPSEQETLARLNAEYEAAFPGLRYVVFVNGRPRSAIFADMRRRIARGDAQAERDEAIGAMCDIALDRARKMGGEDTAVAEEEEEEAAARNGERGKTSVV